MVSRRDKRRLAHQGAVFASVDRATDLRVQAMKTDVVGNLTPELPLSLISNGLDDVFIVPNACVTITDSAIDRRIASGAERPGSEPGVRVVDDGDTNEYSLWNFASSNGTAVQETEATVQWIARLTNEATANAEARSIAPHYGFLASQTRGSAEDPEGSAILPRPTGLQGTGVRIEIIDTGLFPGWAWQASNLVTGDVDPPTTRDGFLTRFAGHGTFMAGVLHQVAPGATIRVDGAVSGDGLIAEQGIANRLRALALDPPDIVVLSVGGYAIKLGSFGTTPAGAEAWIEPLLLQGAIRSFVEKTARRGTIVIMAAGNDNSIDRCFPAAFALGSAYPWNDGRLVSVGALDRDGWRAHFSNYGGAQSGPWVTASALGVRLRSTFVPGRENPIYEPDFGSESWGPDAFARWSGTSFSAPLVAARVAAELSALRDLVIASATAKQAWDVIYSTSPTCLEPECGRHISVPGVAHS